jgi:1,4-dihydroxy-2-naphthoate octaprenyltransferase
MLSEPGHLCMYICIYVCTYVFMYVHMYLCMYICIYVCTYVCVKIVEYSTNKHFKCAFGNNLGRKTKRSE